MTTPTMGYHGKLMLKDASRGNVLTTFPFESESLMHEEARLENSGIRGTRTHEEDMSVGGPTKNAGSISLTPNRFQLEMLLYELLGLSTVAAATEAGDNNAQISTVTAITGVVPGVNTDASRIIYVSIIDDTGGFFHIAFFRDSARTLLVAHTATYNSTGAKALIADNNSGIGGSITVSAVTAADADITLTVNSITYSLTEAKSSTFYAEIWRNVGGGTFSGGSMSKGTLTGEAGGLLKFAMDLIFKTWADLGAATAENLLAGLPYVHSGLVFTFNAVAYRIKSFEFAIDHALKDDHRNNSQDLQELPPGDRMVTLKVVAPYTATPEALIALTMAKTAGAVNDYAASLAFTHPDNHTVTITLPRCTIEKSQPVIGSRDGEVDLPLEIVALGSTTRNDECTITVTTV